MGRVRRDKGIHFSEGETGVRRDATIRGGKQGEDGQTHSTTLAQLSVIRNRKSRFRAFLPRKEKKKKHFLEGKRSKKTCFSDPDVKRRKRKAKRKVR